jgi:L-ascorbate metabolism protein UlaG (beta-lactamase superfamily)
MHYDTFDVISQDAGAFKKHVEAMGRRCEVMKPGDTLRF